MLNVQRYNRKKRSRFSNLLRELQEQAEKLKCKDRETAALENFLESKIESVFEKKLNKFVDLFEHRQAKTEEQVKELRSIQ